MKRELNNTERQSNKSPKKLKSNAQLPKAVSPEPEAEIDSDPIVESDTTEQSGDDGTSWPSDQENADEESGDSGGGAMVIEQQSQQAMTNSTNGSSKEAHAKQKLLVQERKAAKPHADSIARTKKIWERLRRQSHVPLAERKELVAELFAIITGRVKELVKKHDAGRVVQCALKYANIDQRKMIARELRGEYCNLAESRYAKFMIGKLLVHGDSEIRDMVIPEFYGKVRRLIKHPEASWILDDIYRGAATPKQKARLLSEWYGAEFAIFTPEQSPSSLQSLLEAHPEKRAPVMRHLLELINQLIQKKTAGFTMLHDAMLQYYVNVVPGSAEALEFGELLRGDDDGDLLKNLAFSKSGARLVCLALAYGSAKDRKLMLRVYKSHVLAMSMDPHAHQILLAAMDVIDDTVLTSKFILGELLPKDPAALTPQESSSLLSQVTHLTARIPLLYPFVAKAASILPPDDLDLVQEIHTIRQTTSKKDAVVRKRELAAAASPLLFKYLAAEASSLLPSSFGCQLISALLLGGYGDKSAVLAVLADRATQADTTQLLASPPVGRMLKALVLGGHYDAKSRTIVAIDPPLGFADLLFARLGRQLVDWAAGAQSFVVVGMLESADFHHKEELRAMLLAEKNSLSQAVEGAKYSHLKPKDQTEGREQAGIKGTRLVLSLLDQ